MEENKDVRTELMDSITGYYMEFLKKNLYWKEDGEKFQAVTEKINNFINSKIDSQEYAIINKDEIVNTIKSVTLDGIEDGHIIGMEMNELNGAFPDVVSVFIERGEIARFREGRENGYIIKTMERKDGYLYVSDEYYDSHIQEIEKQIKDLEKVFSAKDIARFEEQYAKDLIIKQHELDTSREYENLIRQVKEKQTKYDAVKNRMIGDYGKKYHEIMERDISDAEKQKLLAELLEETKSYDKKTNAAAVELEMQSDEIYTDYHMESKESDQIIAEMEEMYLFDKERYLQVKKGEYSQELEDLYRNKNGLNDYRREQGKPIYKVKPNAIMNLLNSIAKNMRGEKEPLQLEYHPEKDISNGVNSIVGTVNEADVDKALVETLAHLYAERVNEKEFPSDFEKDEPPIDTKDFEAHLVKYFTVHYQDLKEEGFNNFLNEFAEMPDIEYSRKKEGELAKICRQYGIDPKKFYHFGYTFSIRDGLIYESENSIGKINEIYYATEEGINSKIEDLYGKALYEDHTSDGSFKTNDPRALKNKFVEYAKQHGMKIEHEYVLETMQVNQEKVDAIAGYLNEMIQKSLKTKDEDYTQAIAQDIAENYSTIMNVNSYFFDELQSVKSIMGNQYLDEDYLQIKEDSILKIDDSSPRIVYATKEYCAREYANIMEKIQGLNETTDPFLEGYFDLTKANAQKAELRRYIQEKHMDIDTSVKTEVPADQEKIKKIANALAEKYSDKAKNPETFESSITQKLQDNWSEIMTEMQVVKLNEMFQDEMKEHSFVTDELYIRDDFAYVGDFDNYDAKCIYATPQKLESLIASLDKTIRQKDSFMANSEKNARNVLTKYAEENNITLHIPKLVDTRSYPKTDINSRLGFGMFDTPDDPTAREKLTLEENGLSTIFKMSEGNPGAITSLSSLMKDDPMNGFMLMLGLDDMNMRGSQVWTAYKYYCHEDIEKFKEVIHNRDKDMVAFVNEQMASVDAEKAVTSGASFDRSKMPSKYRFTEEEVNEIRENRETRLRHEKFERLKAEEQKAKAERKSKSKLDLIKEKREGYRERKINEGRWNKFLKEIEEDKER